MNKLKNWLMIKLDAVPRKRYKEQCDRHSVEQIRVLNIIEDKDRTIMLAIVQCIFAERGKPSPYEFPATVNIGNIEYSGLLGNYVNPNDAVKVKTYHFTEHMELRDMLIQFAEMGWHFDLLRFNLRMNFNGRTISHTEQLSEELHNMRTGGSTK